MVGAKSISVLGHSNACGPELPFVSSAANGWSRLSIVLDEMSQFYSTLDPWERREMVQNLLYNVKDCGEGGEINARLVF